MAGKKRTRNGEIKPSLENPQPADKSAATITPTCAEPELPPSTTTTTPTKDKPPTQPIPPASTPHPPHTTSAPHKPQHIPPKNRQKLPKLPSNATISKRPLLHPALPTPFASSSAPKVLYITATTPFIPALKRIRKLLAAITQRAKQSLATQAKRPRPRLEANRRLGARDVERGIVEGVKGGKSVGGGGGGLEGGGRKDGEGGGEGEAVYLKATGRAIPRALELGVYFQGEEEGCWVRVEMGSVCAVDDVEMDGEVEGEEEVPETRMRMLSSVTVRIGLK